MKYLLALIVTAGMCLCAVETAEAGPLRKVARVAVKVVRAPFRAVCKCENCDSGVCGVGCVGCGKGCTCGPGCTCAPGHCSCPGCPNAVSAGCCKGSGCHK